MDELISRKALLAEIMQDIETSGCVNHEKDMLDSIRYAPTIDPVRHASWEAVNERCNHAAVFRCSGRDGCGASVDYGHYTRFCDYEWCPNCGARMDGEE